MPREIKPELLEQGTALRRRILETVDRFGLAALGSASVEFEALASEYRDLSVPTAGLREAESANQMADALRLAAQLCRWAAAVLDAAPDAQKFLASAQLLGAALVERMRNERPSPTVKKIAEWVSAVESTSDPKAVPGLLASLSVVPMPVFYFELRDPYELLRKKFLGSEVASDAPPQSSRIPDNIVVKILFFLDGQPWLTPQAIKSGVQYDLDVQVAASRWPGSNWHLDIDYVSIADPATYYITPLSVSAETISRERTQHGHLIFHNPQSLLSEPSVLTVRARFVSSDGKEAMTPAIVGHTELRVRALSPESYPILTHYPTMDIQIPKIFEEVRVSLADLAPSDLDDFLKVLVHVSSYAAMVAQTGVFKGKRIDEKRDFQQHMLQALRMQLGEEVHEAETVGGGILDLRYRKIVIELKVEYDQKDRKKLKEKYVSQPCQYNIASIPVSVTCILDMTEKDHVPPNVGNDLSLETPLLHGYGSEPPSYPSKVAVLIIEGNLRSPSSYPSGATALGKRSS
jgi:hypothetical protein